MDDDLTPREQEVLKGSTAAAEVADRKEATMQMMGEGADNPLANLALRLQAGDEEVALEIVRRLSPTISRIAKGFKLSSNSEDIAGDVIVRLLLVARRRGLRNATVGALVNLVKETTTNLLKDQARRGRTCKGAEKEEPGADVAVSAFRGDRDSGAVPGAPSSQWIGQSNRRRHDGCAEGFQALDATGMPMNRWVREYEVSVDPEAEQAAAELRAQIAEQFDCERPEDLLTQATTTVGQAISEFILTELPRAQRLAVLAHLRYGGPLVQRLEEADFADLKRGGYVTNLRRGLERVIGFLGKRFGSLETAEQLVKKELRGWRSRKRERRPARNEDR